eukprot:42076-Prymnesium_polylepis.1
MGGASTGGGGQHRTQRGGRAVCLSSLCGSLAGWGSLQGALRGPQTPPRGRVRGPAACQAAGSVPDTRWEMERVARVTEVKFTQSRSRKTHGPAR